jgi:hypothetical protein
MLEGRADAHRDAKVGIYLQGVGGIVLTTMGLSGFLHHMMYHNPGVIEILTFVLAMLVGCYLIYKAYQDFKEKYHQFALATAKKM